MRACSIEQIVNPINIGLPAPIGRTVHTHKEGEFASTSKADVRA
jgi:hypothetical protein